MICSECGINDATIKYKRINDGIIENKEVCKLCYENQTQNIEYSKARISKKLNFNNVDIDQNKKCDFCGRSLEEIKNTAYVGCEYCYQTFKEDLYNILENYHKVKIGDKNE